MENQSNVEQTNNGPAKRRPGKTILINHNGDYSLDSYTGISSVFTTDNGSKFVQFDTVDNSVNAFSDLISNDVRVKYSYYKMFFRVKNVDLSSVSYDDLKTRVINSLGDGVNVLYFKLYKNNGALTGSGDLVLDTKESLDNLVKDGSRDLGNGSSVQMYRYIMKGRRTRNQSQERQQEI